MTYRSTTYKFLMSLAYSSPFGVAPDIDDTDSTTSPFPGLVRRYPCLGGLPFYSASSLDEAPTTPAVLMRVCVGLHRRRFPPTTYSCEVYPLHTPRKSLRRRQV